MADRGLLIVFSGPSGVGKGTILKQFMQGRTNCIISVSATTRSPRPGEEDGVDYYFMDKTRFEQMIAEDAMLEYACYGGNYYGTPRGPVEKQLSQGINVILEIELVGALKIKELYPKAVMVFVMPPSMQELRRRLVSRGTEQDEAIALRMQAARTEMEQAMLYDYIIVNQDVEDCCRKFEAIVVAEGCAVRHRKDFIREVSQDA
ncbi:MAG: guanylate kinase [Oscillospiraceae bacterium]|jgi:guanylate kinase